MGDKSQADGDHTSAQIITQENETFFQTLFDAAPIGIYLVDADFCIRAVNPSALPVFENISDLIGRDFDETIHLIREKEHADEIVALFHHTIETGEPYTTPEIVIRQHEPGVTSYYDWQINRILLPEGGYGVVCYFRNISAEIAVRKEIAISEESFRLFVTTSSDAVYKMNADWSEMLSLDGKDFIADTDTQIRGWISKYVVPEDQARIRATIEEAIRHKSIFELEYRVIRPDGKIGWTFSRAVPVIDEKGEIIEWFGTASDVTERNLAQKALQESEAKYRTLFDSIDEGVCLLRVIFDGEGKPVDLLMLEANQAWEQQTGREDITGKTLRSVIPNYEGCWIEDFGKVALTGESARMEEYSASSDRWYSVFASRVGNTGSPLVAVVFNNITSRKRRESGLSFLADVSEHLINLSTSSEIVHIFGARIGEFLGASVCNFIVVNEPKDEVIVTDDWHRADEFSLVGTYHLPDYVTDEFQKTMSAGEPVVIRDINHDARIHDKQKFKALHIGSFINIPLIREGEWRFVLGIYHEHSYEWRSDEIALMTEIANRIWNKLERLRAEEALRESEEKFRMLFDSIDEGFAILEMIYDDAGKLVDMRYLETNRAFAGQTGLPDAKGKTVSELLPNLDRSWFDAYGRVAQTGESVRFENHVSDTDRWFSVYASRVGDDGSRMVAVVFNDISERKKAEAQLLKLNRQIQQQAIIFNKSLSTITDYVYRLDKDGRFIYANQALLDLWGIKEMPDSGISMPDLNYPKEVEAIVLEGVARVFETRKLVKNQTAYLSPTGANEYHEFIFNPVFADDGSVDFIIGSSRDISEHKQMEEALKEADRRKDEFLATLSHELRTPLNAILGWSQILKNPLIASQEIDKGLAIIERSARAQNQLVEDILDVSSIITGKFRLDVRPVDLVKVIMAAVETARPAAEARNIRLQTLLDPEATAISGDPDRLQQIVWNLLSNAVKFTPKDGRVQIRLERVNSHVEIVVSDTGKGIAPEFLPYVFDRFRQFDGSMTRRQGGLGLGLAIVRQIVELHGGTVSVESGGENQGATFTISLPFLPVRNEPESEIPRVHSGIQNTKLPLTINSSELSGLRILIVDDEQDSRELLNMIISSAGATIKQANSAQEAFDLIKTEPFDILISDIGMPEEDGFSLIKKVRMLLDEQGGRIPAVALTAYARSEDRVTALRSGFQMHIAKPIESQELIAIVANLGEKMRNPN